MSVDRRQESEVDADGRAAWRIEIGNQSILTHMSEAEVEAFVAEFEPQAEALVAALKHERAVNVDAAMAVKEATAGLRSWLLAHPALQPVPEAEPDSAV